MTQAALRPSARRVLERLRQGPATTHDLCQPDVGGLRFGARLLELREAGMEVSEERLPLPTRGSLYRLLSEPEVEQAASEPSGPAAGARVGIDGEVAGSIPAPWPKAGGSSEKERSESGPPAEPHGGLFDAGAFHHSDGFGDAA